MMALESLLQQTRHAHAMALYFDMTDSPGRCGRM